MLFILAGELWSNATEFAPAFFQRLGSSRSIGLWETNQKSEL